MQALRRCRTRREISIEEVNSIKGSIYLFLPVSQPIVLNTHTRPQTKGGHSEELCRAIHLGGSTSPNALTMDATKRSKEVSDSRVQWRTRQRQEQAGEPTWQEGSRVDLPLSASFEAPLRPSLNRPHVSQVEYMIYVLEFDKPSHLESLERCAK